MATLRSKALPHEFEMLRIFFTIAWLFFPPALFSFPSDAAAFSAGEESTLAERIPLTGCLAVDPEASECTNAFTLNRPSPITWEKMRKRLNPQTRILSPREKHLTYTAGTFSKTEIQTINLAQEVSKWLAMNFENASYRADQRWVKSVGNLLEAFLALGRDTQARQERLKQLENDYPRIWQEVKAFLPEWVVDDFLYLDGWDPRYRGRPEEAENDGILERPPFLCPASQGQIYGLEYRENETRKIFQACAPIFADLARILAAEHDFQNYYRQVGANYLEVYPFKESFFSGKDPAGVSFLLYDVSFSGKPLPLWHIKFELRQFLHYEAGRWQIENRLLGGDMNRLRLRIFFDPIYTTDGKIIGYVKTEWMDVDLKGLPDRDGDRLDSVRGEVGNIKRMAEGQASF